ncbi:MAG: LAGLIDADG family homing endonuclease [Candidatus Nanoarchaeia archaeon]|nr:LAGLIDADG family homing endonuclease [Candidatus Nanoarchaeia archaeon]
MRINKIKDINYANKNKLAEFIGIMLGDGNIYSKDGTHRIVVTGHCEEDYDYLTNYVKPLIKNLFGREASLWNHKNKNAIALAVYSKILTENLITLGLVAGTKTMKIPKFIKTKKEYIAKFIRGVADTDFSISFTKKHHTYPLITGSFSNKEFTEEIISLLKNFDMKANLYSKCHHGFMIYKLDLYGRENLQKWMKNIGFSNPKHLTKIAIWNKIGYYEPYTPYGERLKILEQ